MLTPFEEFHATVSRKWCGKRISETRCLSISYLSCFSSLLFLSYILMRGRDAYSFKNMLGMLQEFS